MEDKKISFYLNLLAVGNILSLLLIFGVIGFLAANSGNGLGGRSIPKEITTKVPEAVEVKDNAEMTKDAKSGVYVLEITDTGFNPEGMSALIGQKISIEVSNKSKIYYEFRMGSLNVEPITLAPGEKKDFFVEAPADLEKETGFAYKAVSVDGSGPEFAGVLILAKGKE